MPTHTDLTSTRREFLGLMAGAALIVATPSPVFAAQSMFQPDMPEGMPTDLGKITDRVERTFDLGGL